MPDFTVIVVTHNRAEVLRHTLSALARLTYPGTWEALVADNNSTDHTGTMVSDLEKEFPVPLRYLFEGKPGKYFALNAAIAASKGTFIAATDDDAYPEADWLQRALEGFEAYQCDFVGGPVYPVWRATPPRWVDPRDSITGKVLGLQDHGVEPREYGCGGLSWPLGVNVAYRRDGFARVGLFDGRLGRLAGTLRNQSQREWHLRARSAGLRGMYLPGMVVRHSVDAERLTRRYFQRWFYWHGISRAVMYQTQGVHLLEPESGATHGHERHVFGVPTSLWRKTARAIGSAGRRWATARFDDAVEYELALCFCAGVIRQQLKRRGHAAPPQPAAAGGAPALPAPADRPQTRQPPGDAEIAVSAACRDTP